MSWLWAESDNPLVASRLEVAYLKKQVVRANTKRSYSEKLVAEVCDD